MSVNYSLVVRNAEVNNSEIKKVYAQAQAKEVLTLEQFAEHISDHNSLFDKSTIIGVLIKMVVCLKEQLLEGNQVQFGDLGKFYVTITGKGANSASEYVASNIKKLNVRFSPSDKLKNLVDEASFEQVATVAAKKAALASQKLSIDEAIDENGSGSGSGDTSLGE